MIHCASNYLLCLYTLAILLWHLQYIIYNILYQFYTIVLYYVLLDQIRLYFQEDGLTIEMNYISEYLKPSLAPP